MDIIEKVARAFCESGKEVCGLPPNNCKDVCDGCRFQARAAIEALRLPPNTSEKLTMANIVEKQNYHELARNFNRVLDCVLET